MGATRPGHAQTADPAVKAQWFTGTLEAPSPALSAAGAIVLEPYAIYTGLTGAYDGGWRLRSAAHNSHQVQSFTLLQYGVTDRLTVQALPSASYLWDDRSTSGGVRLGDLPVDLLYRVSNSNDKTGLPSVTLDLGVTFPTGSYDRLSSPLNGLGSGAFTIKEGVLFQSLFNTLQDHPMRIRLYGDLYEPIADVSVRDASIYGTSPGFRGRAKPGAAAQAGIGGEYAFTQRWVLALDLVYSYNSGYRINGNSPPASAIPVLAPAPAIAGFASLSHAPNSTNIAVAPAVEYNWSPNAGIVVGVELSVGGRNSPSYVAPQIALSLAF